MVKSYSSKTKEALRETIDKKNCCRRILSDIENLQSANEDEHLRIIDTAPSHFKCDNCFSAFLRGLFLVFGNVTDPSKRYHLELSFASEAVRDAVFNVINDHGIEMKCAKRKQRYLLYIKDSEKIEDFFAAIGANKAAFELINSKIVREVRGDANRQSNCDMANIKKSLNASKKYTDLIEKMIDTGAVLKLPSELRETAELRIANPQASMADLALLHKIPISKSGVKHRLDKIAEIASENDNLNNKVK